MKRFKFFIEETEKLFKQDNPGGDWLKRKQQHADEAIHRYKNESLSS